MAAEFCISIAAKISEYLVEPLLIRPFRPIFCFQSIVDDFLDQNKRLTAIQEKVQNDVKRNKDNARVIYDHVEKWVKEVKEEVMPQVSHLIDLLGGNKSCLWCPNWTCHYTFSKQVSKMAATMKTLCEEGHSFSSVLHPPALHQDIRPPSSASFMHSQSSRLAFNQIMEALKGHDINMIRLYGGAGSGKTTMAQLVGKEAQKLSYRVIIVPVAQYPLVSSQQDFIAEFLDLQFDQLKIEQGRAAKLRQRLQNDEKILIIFDDVQKEFDLGTVIGIPSSDSGCKILLTTPHVDTLNNIKLGALSEDEAWTLLKSTAAVGDEVRMHDVVKDALADCNGLPKAIVAMGTVLNGKGVQEWGDTLQQHKAAKLKITDGLREGVKKLSLRQDAVNINIRTAKQNVEEIYQEVETWLKDVERVMTNVEQFEIELKKSIWCFDERSVESRIDALVTSVKDLQEQGNFDKVSHPTPLEPGMRLLSSEDFLFSKAAKSAFNQILEAWKTDSVNMIGLYGMGGIGKTTLAKQVHNEVIRQNALAVMVTVSQKPDMGNIQDEIARCLNLKFEKDTPDVRAIKLRHRLKDEQILIILDDVWKKFDLRSIGITLNNSKGCKILVTTRRRDVCSSMNCQSKVQLNLFSKDESQNLFKKKAGLSNEFELDDVGKQIVAECKCLPIALETVGAALKGKDNDAWIDALKHIRDASLVDIIGVDNEEKNVYRCLRLSYDYLNDQPQGLEAQFILLLCSLFPEDYEIEVEDLTRYAFGMELFKKVNSIKEARRKVRVVIRFLTNSCLLLDVGGEEYVKLHDVVRDVLLWIGATEPQERNTTLTVTDNVTLKDLIKEKSFQNCKALSVTSDVIPKFSKCSKLKFPKLEIILILGKDLVEFGEGFFEHMEHLKVLDVRSSSTSRWRRCEFAMPQSLRCLEHLRTLMLRNCGCSNSSILRDLGRLRILSLRECRIDCGVEVVSGLKKLRLLDLSERMMLTSDVTERLVKLEELYGCTFGEQGTSNRLSELKLPSSLVAMSAKVEDTACLPTDFCFPKLESYDIHIGEHTDILFSSTREVRRLVLVCIGKDVMMKTCEKLLPTVQWLGLYECHDLYSLPSLRLQELETLDVYSCSKMEWVLKCLFLSDDFTCCSFTNLRELKVIDCEKVKAIFPLMKSTGRAHPQSHLPNLQKIELRSNGQLKHIWEGRTRLLSLCNLTQVNITDCPELICIFPSQSLAASLQQLEILRIDGCSNLEDVFSERGGSDDDDFTCFCFKNLRELKLSKCHKVKAIFPLMKSTSRAAPRHPQNHPCRLPKLQKIVVEDNSLLEHIFGHQTQVLECPCLQVLKVTRCPQIPTTHFVATQLQPPSSKSYIQIVEARPQTRHADLPQSTIICFSFLNTVKLEDCNKLKQVFTTSIVNSFHNLEKLIVRRCNELEEVIMVEDGNKERENDATREMIGKVGFEKLEVLHVSDCKKLKTVFSTFIVPLPKLHTLLLQSNAVLESLFGRSGGDVCTSHWARLSVLSVTGCPKLCTETVAIVKSQLQVQSTTEEAIRIINLSNIQGVEELIQLPRQEGDDKYILKAEELGDLKRIWSGPTQDISFSFLLALRVKGCSRLKQLFTTTMATSLHNLVMLLVERCDDLEQIIEQEEGNEENNTQSVQQLELSELRILRLIDLPKLASFCPTSSNLVFPYLTEKMLKVKGCPKQITDFFSKQSYFEGEDDQVDDVEYDSEGEDDEFHLEYDEEDDIYFEKFVGALLGLRPKS